jgi:hypothetical protein
VVVVGHPGGKLIMGAFPLKPVFHQNTALREELKGRINGRPGDPVSGIIHVYIELVGRKMVIQLGDPVEDPGPFLGATVLLPAQVVGEVLF